MSTQNPPFSLLIIGDDVNSLELLVDALSPMGLEILTASDPVQGLDLVLSRHPRIVITELVMPRVSGLEILERISKFDPSIDVVLLAADYSPDAAVEAINRGARDYLNKSTSIKSLKKRIGKLVDEVRQDQRTAKLENELLSASEFEGIIGHSPIMQNIFATIRRVAPHYRSLLITGDTGTGKDLVARALHRLSPAHNGQLVALNCSALVPTLFESELLGHVKGAFTGAFEDKPGLVEQANGGTLFLDEIADMLYPTQAKLLRVLQNQEVQRVGSLELRKVDVRVIAASNRDLRTAMVKKHFREDLYYRLARVEIHMPRLVERKEDLPLLERHFIARFAAQYRKSIRGLTPRAQIVLGLYSWPGNVRELENVLGHACMMTRRDTLDIEDFPAYLPQATGYVPASGSESTPDESGYRGALDEQERLLVLHALQTAGGNQSRAARILHIGRDAMRYKMKKHNLRASPLPGYDAAARPGSQ